MRTFKNLLEKPNYHFQYDFISFKGLHIDLMEGRKDKDADEEYLLCIELDEFGRVHDYMFVKATEINLAKYFTRKGEVNCRFHNPDRRGFVRENEDDITEEEFVINSYISIVKVIRKDSVKYMLLLKNHEHLRRNSEKGNTFNDDDENMVYIDNIEFHLFTHYYTIEKHNNNLPSNIRFSKFIDLRFQLEKIDDIKDSFKYGSVEYDAVGKVMEAFETELQLEYKHTPRKLYSNFFDRCIYRDVATGKDVLVTCTTELVNFMKKRKVERENLNSKEDSLL